MGFFSDAKDRVVEATALSMINKSFLEPYGKATKLRIDSTAKAVVVELDLKGETSLLEVRINNYELIKAEDGCYGIVHEMTTSRAWLTTLAEQQLLGRRLKIPPQAAKLLLRML